jgi:predicted AAA+ superfamily ATPase
VPELTSYLQPLVDEDPRSGRFILTGSQQFEVMTTITQSLAGRTAVLKLLPLSIEELAGAGIDLDLETLLLTGFYPRVHTNKLDPTQALGDYVETYVQRDIRQLMAIKDLNLFERFLRLCAGRTGQLLNLQSLGSDVGISHTTARAWLTLLEASYVLFLLQPWHANISKRQVKSPKIYFYDVGLAGYLLGIEDIRHVVNHPLRGNLFENLVVAEALKYRFHRGRRNNLFFWRDAKGNEIDLLLEHGPDIHAVEIKAGATIASHWFKGLQTFAATIPTPPKTAGIVYGGPERQNRSQVTVWPIQDISAMLTEYHHQGT